MGMSAWSYQSPPELSDEQYARWQNLLEERSGICFLQHKSILQKGLRQRMREVGVEDYEQYYERVSSVPAGVVEWSLLVDRIAVKETSFFREPHSFDVVRQKLTDYLDMPQPPRHLALWSVGCSTGEEPYSLAMQTQEVIDEMGTNTYFGVTATDISRTALDIGRTGQYATRKLATLPATLRHKYFVSDSKAQATVVPSLKQKVCFVQGNIIKAEQMPTMAMDIIYCQNVLIYFRRDRLLALLGALVKQLKPGGLLVLGPGEVVNWQHPEMRRTGDDTVNAYVKLSHTTANLRS